MFYSYWTNKGIIIGPIAIAFGPYQRVDKLFLFQECLSHIIMIMLHN